MDLCDKNTIKDILKDNKIWAKKKLGQHFLVSQKTLNKIIKTAELSDQDTILEIGPGLGVLTQGMAKQAKLVLGIEKDRAYVEWLRKYFKSKKNVKIICDDILQFSIFNFQFSKYKIVSNLPYQITSPVIRKFLTADNKPTEMILMVQKEMAERICAKAGSSKRGFLTVFVEFYVENVEIVEIVDRDCFWPKPKVESAIIRLKNIKTRKHKSKEIPMISLKANQSRILDRTKSVGTKEHKNGDIRAKSFFALVKAGFSQKRRQIHNPLSASLHLPKDQINQLLEKALIDKAKRAEDLSLDQWIKLYQTLNREI